MVAFQSLKDRMTHCVMSKRMTKHEWDVVSLVRRMDPFVEIGLLFGIDRTALLEDMGGQPPPPDVRRRSIPVVSARKAAIHSPGRN